MSWNFIRDENRKRENLKRSNKNDILKTFNLTKFQYYTNFVFSGMTFKMRNAISKFIDIMGKK